MKWLALGAAVALAGGASPALASKTVKNRKDGLRYVAIPPGAYTGGCPESEAACDEAEKPARAIRIDKGFRIGQTEVTVASYKRFARATGEKMPPEPNFRGGRTLNAGWSRDDLPIAQITWDEGKRYCEWAGGRLPTAIEWEYAARAGATGLLHGDVDRISWNGGNSGKPWDYAKVFKEQAGGDGRRMLDLMKGNDNGMHAVARKEPNAWGLYDVLGNVLEWVSDWEVEGTRRANRGASWITGPDLVRFTTRTSGALDYRSNYLGLRCVQD